MQSLERTKKSVFTKDGNRDLITKAFSWTIVSTRREVHPQIHIIDYYPTIIIPDHNNVILETALVFSESRSE